MVDSRLDRASLEPHISNDFLSIRSLHDSDSNQPVVGNFLHVWRYNENLRQDYHAANEAQNEVGTTVAGVAHTAREILEDGTMFFFIYIWIMFVLQILKEVR